MNEYINTFHSTETNLEIALGTINFKDQTIRNLRYQISALRKLAEDSGMTDKEISEIQFAHQKI